MRSFARACLLSILACSIPAASAADWPRFRGPHGTAVSADKGLPETWSDKENVAWKAALPGPGSSSPIVSGDRIFVTCYSGYGVDRGNPGEPEKLTRHLVCVNLADGKLLWDKSVPATLPEDRYGGRLQDHGYASSTPAADDQRVYAFFGKSGVVAFDREGEQVWKTGVGTGSAIMGWGSGASLVLHNNLVIVNANAESQALVALDQETGREVWKAEAKGYSGSWSTPVLVNVGDKQEVVVNMPGEVWGLNPKDGGLLWFCEVLRGAGTTSLAVQDGVVYAVSGGPGGSGVWAVRAGGRDDVSTSHMVWKKSVGSYVPSPVSFDGYLYWTDERGVAHCLTTDTGEQVYRERLPDAGGVYASTLAADGKLYVVTRGNGTIVLAAGPAFKQLAHNRLESDTGDFNASPAVADGRLLLRSNRFLYCIGGK